MELKYKIDDVIKMIEAFDGIYQKQDKGVDDIVDEMLVLCQYPADVVKKFVTAMEAACNNVPDDEMDAYVEKNYMGVLAYITLRINL